MKEIKLPQEEGLNEMIPFIRVGCTYYKRILKQDRNGFAYPELRVWMKSEIIQDYGKEYIKGIPHYDDFTLLPNNVAYKSVVNECYNLYSPFCHVPKEGDFTWTKRIMEHIFGEEQLDLGYRYMQILYLHPDRSTIILALISAERGTGKTTFANWLHQIFGNNAITIGSSDFVGNFNAHYGSRNIIIIEETLLEKQISIEKLKQITTAKSITINEKYAAITKLPFYGKVVLTSNNERKFAKIDMDEVRFFVRKLSMPKYTNHAIEENLREEIPAFLHYLKSLPSVDWTVSRSGFTPTELMNNSLEAVVAESKSALCKDLEMYIEDYFVNHQQCNAFYAAPLDIKVKFFNYENRYEPSYIRSVLKDELKMRPQAMMRYTPFVEDAATKTGTPYLFIRQDFVKNEKV